MDPSKKTIHISQLFLDSENPRHNIIEHQNEIIKQLFENEKIESLAADIAEKNRLNPLDSVGVIETEKDKYIVIEGNRRVCACILLNNPGLAPGKDNIAKMKKISEKGKPPHEIECAVFASRDAADHWIKLRHEGPQDGVGTREWNAEQKTRYAMKKGRRNPNAQTIELLDYAVKSGIIAPEEKDSFSVTTLKRFLGNPVVRNVFGLQNNKTLESRHDESTFKNLVTQFLDDAREKKQINSRTKKEQWIEYANTLQSKIPSPPPDDSPITDYGNKPTSEPEETKPEKKKRSRQDPAKRKYLTDKTSFSITDKILNRVYHEMKTTAVENHEFSVAFLFRAFMERTAFLYLHKHDQGKLNKESKLHQKLNWVSSHLKEVHQVPQKKLRPLDVASSSQNAKTSPIVLGMMVHLTHIPTKRELIHNWDTLENVLHLIHKYLD